MEYRLSSTTNWHYTSNQSSLYTFPELRLMTMPAGGWAQANITNVAPFSAICFLTGRALMQHLQSTEKSLVPVGLVDSSVGGTPAQFWMSCDAIDSCDAAVQNNSTNGCGSLFGNHILPLTPMSFKAILWDQGESNMSPLTHTKTGTALLGHAGAPRRVSVFAATASHAPKEALALAASSV